MAEQKTSISELSAATAVATSDLLFISQQDGGSWTSKKAAVSQLPYALSSHTHSNYALTSHNHTGVYAPATHVHGNIQSGGTLQTTDVAIASGDKLVVTDSSDSSKVARTSLSFDGSTTTQFLTKKGTWGSALTAHQSLTGYVSKAELKTTLASVGQIPGGDGANLENTIAKFNALFSALSALTD